MRSATIALFGRTGAGKSSLANKIIGEDHFKVGHRLISETESVASEIFTWPLDPTLKIKLVDTPGFADNRPEMTNGILLSKILDFLQSMKDGLNIALYCLPAKARIDQHDTQELEMLGLLLGNAFFDHACIVITQTNAFTEESKQRICENFKRDLLGIFEKNDLPPIPNDRILFADFDNLNQAFLEPLTVLIQTTNSYIPELSEEIDAKDPESIKRFLAKPEMKEVMNRYEDMIAEQKKEMKEMQQTITKQAQETQQMMTKHQQAQSTLQKNLENVNTQLRSTQVLSETHRKHLEDYKRQEETRLKALNQRMSSLNDKNDYMQKMMDRKDNDIKTLNTKMTELQNTKNQPPQIIYRDKEKEPWCFQF